MMFMELIVVNTIIGDLTLTLVLSTRWPDSIPFGLNDDVFITFLPIGVQGVSGAVVSGGDPRSSRITGYKRCSRS